MLAYLAIQEYYDSMAAEDPDRIKAAEDWLLKAAEANLATRSFWLKEGRK